MKVLMCERKSKVVGDTRVEWACKPQFFFEFVEDEVGFGGTFSLGGGYGTLLPSAHTSFPSLPHGYGYFGFSFQLIHY